MRMLSLILLVLVAATAGIHANAQPEIILDSGVKPEFSSSVACAKCHLDIYNYWKDSLHAHALKDNIFQASFMIALRDKGDEIRKVCLGCHVPTTVSTEDTMLELPLSAEAVTCDFCHRISGVSFDENVVKATITSGEEKYGPLEIRDTSGSHPSVKKGLFEDSKFCATCHQWSNEQGIPIFDTYREWLNSSFAKQGIHCQNCHMPKVEGMLVTDRPRERDNRINSHNLSGGHSIVQVASAAKMRIASVSRVTGGLQAVVEVTNVGSGHMIPTGIPSRALVLIVQLLDSGGDLVETEEHVFTRVILDDGHNELTGDADIILNGAMISKDNRIPPGETVTIPFNFAASPMEKYLVRATLHYRYRPLVLKEEEISVEMGTDTKGI